MRARLPISVLLLARDEVSDLEALLPTLDFASEVVLVWDPRGDVRVRLLAEQLGARVIEHVFEGFGAQRAFALSACREPWVLWIDADERLDREASESLPRALEAGDARAYEIARRTWFLGAPIRFCGWQGESVLRLFPRLAASFDDAAVHEEVRLEGVSVERWPGRIEHHSYATWERCVEKPRAYAHLAAAEAHREGRRASLLDLLWRPPLRFLRQYVLQLGVLDGARGLLVSSLGAWQVFLKYGELWASSRARR